MALPNQHICQRLAGIQKILIGAYESSAAMSSASKGHERASLIDHFLSKVFPSPFRFGTGDATDASGHRSGQLDVVVENPFAPSLPAEGSDQSRLYIAENIAAVLEVKSDLSGQWKEAVATAQKLSVLRPNFRVK